MSDVASTTSGDREGRKILRLGQFALVCFLVLVAYPGIRLALAIPSFHRLMEGMDVEAPSRLITQGGLYFLALAWLLPGLAILTLRARPTPRVLHFLGIIALLVLLNTALLWSGLPGVSAGMK